MTTLSSELYVNFGTTPNDGTGDPLRVAFITTQTNIDNLFTFLGNGPEFANATIGNLTTTSAAISTINAGSLIAGTILANNQTITGNLSAAGIYGTVLTASQPYVTSVGTLSGLTVTAPIAGNITGTAANLSGTPTLPNGTSAATQSSVDSTANIATTSFVHSITDALVTGVSAFNTRTGNITLLSSDVTGALTYTPLNKAGDTMSGNLAMSSNQILGLTAIPLGPDAAASKAYVDALVSTSATWVSPIDDPDLNDVVSAVPGSPVAGATYIAYGGSYPQNWGTGANAVVSGDIVSYKQDASAWIVIKNLVAGDRLILAGEHGAVSATLLANGFFKGDIAQYVSGNPALTASWTFPNGRGQGGTPEIAQGTTMLVDISTGEHYGHTYLYDATGNNWIEIAGPGSVGAGIGLSYSGNILNVNLGAGIAQLPSDEVGIDVYIGGGLMTTLDGTTSNTTTNAQLSLTKVGTAGTYTSITTDVHGRVTAGSNPTPSFPNDILVNTSAGGITVGTGNANVLYSTAVGYQALSSDSAGYNSAFGYRAGDAITSGIANTGMGYQVIRDTTTGQYNTALGTSALYQNTTGSYNIAIGRHTLISATTGTRNLAIGDSAGSAIFSGNNNVILGGSTGSAINGLNNRIIIADGAGTERIQIDNNGNCDIVGSTLRVNGDTVAKLNTTQTFTKAQIAAVNPLSVSANAIAIDLSQGNNYSVTLQATTAQQLSNPTNVTAGQSGQIAITQNATPSTITYGTYWVSTDGTVPAVSTTANAVNLLTYYVVDSTHIWFSLSKNGIA